MSPIKPKRVVVTGMGVVSTNGVGLADFETALREGRSGVRYIEILEELGFSCKVGGVPPVTETIKEKYFSALTRKQLQADGVLYGCIAGLEAWELAGLKKREREEDPDWESGAIFGAGLAGADVIRNAAYTIDAKKIKRLGSITVPQTMSGGVSAYLGGMLGLANQVTTNASACSTGTEAIVMGYERIQVGKATRMLCGGCDSSSPYVWAGFDALRALTRKGNDVPEAASRPMSASASGFVPGGGAGAVLLEERESALARGATIYAELLGGYVNSGGQRNGGTMTAPNPKGILHCIQGALADAQITADQIDAISGHLTATMFDPHEVKLWTEALGRRGTNFPYLSSLKSMTGHCLSASGAMEGVAAILQLHHGFLHPSINCEDIHPDIAALISADCIPQQAIEKELQTVISSSFGFGDANSCVIFGKG